MLNFLGLSAVAVGFILILLKLGALSVWVVILKAMLAVTTAATAALLLAVAVVRRRKK